MKRTTAVLLACLVPLMLAACGGGQSNEDRIRDVVERIQNAKEPAGLQEACRELLTPAFVKEVYGGDIAACSKEPFNDEKEFDNPGETTVASVEVDDPNATVKIETVGGSTDGTDGTWTMKNVDGDWRLDRLEDDYLRASFATSVKLVDEGMVAFEPMRKCFASKVETLDSKTIRAITFGEASEKKKDAFDAANKIAEGCPRALNAYVADTLAKEVLAKKDLPPKTIECAKRELLPLLEISGLAPNALKQNNEYGFATSAALAGLIIGAVRAC